MSTSVIASGSLLRDIRRFIEVVPAALDLKFGWRLSPSFIGTRPGWWGDYSSIAIAIAAQPWSSAAAVPEAAQGSCPPFRSFQGQFPPGLACFEDFVPMIAVAAGSPPSSGLGGNPRANHCWCCYSSKSVK